MIASHTVMEIEQSASTPPAAAAKGMPGQLFGEALQVIQLQCYEADRHQCD